ncbi:unnamed protein product [Gordionus sp. m RMFG-2023]
MEGVCVKKNSGMKRSFLNTKKEIENVVKFFLNYTRKEEREKIQAEIDKGYTIPPIDSDEIIQIQTSIPKGTSQNSTNGKKQKSIL